MARPSEEGFPRVWKDNCCMSGLGTLRLQSQLKESSIKYITYENEVKVVKLFKEIDGDIIIVHLYSL